jgi:hypothetical protein
MIGKHMQYMMILTASPEAWAHNDAVVDDGVIDDWGAYTRALHEAGVLVSGQALHGNDMATTVQVRQRERIVTDGVFAETKEHIIGYYVIEAVDLDAAIAWAAKAPNARIGSVEVRPLVEGTSTDAMLATAGQ